MLKETITIKADVLVIGSGAAGLRAAIEAKAHACDVMVVSSSRTGLGNNTAISGRGFAASNPEAVPQDSPEKHLQDTLIGGRFINNQALVDAVTRTALQQVYDLQRFGVQFRRRDGGFLVESVPGMRHPRTHMCRESTLGTSFSLPMVDYARNTGVRFLQGIFICSLIKKGKRIAGAAGLDHSGQTYSFQANSVILATGGLGHLYLRNDNAKGATGDGYALAYHCGVPLVDMEFIQFYPTTRGKTGSHLLTSEPFVLAGAVFRNALGQDIMKRHGFEDPTQMTRDRVSRSLMQETMEGRAPDGFVMLDLAGISEKELNRIKDNMHPHYAPQENITPVAPAAHFCMGGMKIYPDGHTNIPGLYGAGEVCGGMHGANRLAGNALTCCFATGMFAGAGASDYALVADEPELTLSDFEEALQPVAEALSVKGCTNIASLHDELKHTMWYGAGILRTDNSLKQALQAIQSLKEQMRKANISSPADLIYFLKMRNMLLVSEMVCNSALLRTESRGAHWRSDFPVEDNNWIKNIVITKGVKTMEHELIPVKLDKLSTDGSYVKDK